MKKSPLKIAIRREPPRALAPLDLVGVAGGNLDVQQLDTEALAIGRLASMRHQT